MSESNGSGGAAPQKGPLRRTLDVCVFAPVGLAVTVVEDLPDLVAKGRRRVELEVSNARIVGRFVVRQKQRDLSERLDDIWRDATERGAPVGDDDDSVAGDAGDDSDAGDAGDDSDAGDAGDDSVADGDSVTDATPTPPSPPRGPTARATSTPDPAAAAIVGGALADYDTLSASQVVRRLESLGPDELHAVQRYEASHRNRRTILNRAGQLLDQGPSAVPTD